MIIIIIISCQKHLVLGWLNVPQWCYISCGRVKNMMECRRSCLVNLFSFHFWLMGNNIFCIYGVKLIPEYRSCCSNYVSLQCIVKVKWQLVAKVTVTKKVIIIIIILSFSDRHPFHYLLVIRRHLVTIATAQNWQYLLLLWWPMLRFVLK